jgi:hypothetical protein
MIFACICTVPCSVPQNWCLNYDSRCTQTLSEEGLGFRVQASQKTPWFPRILGAHCSAACHIEVGIVNGNLTHGNLGVWNTRTLHSLQYPGISMFRKAGGSHTLLSSGLNSITNLLCYIKQCHLWCCNFLTKYDLQQIQCPESESTDEGM